MAATNLVVFSLGDLGSRASQLGLVATAEETASSLGYLGTKTAQRGLIGPTRQVASSFAAGGHPGR